MRKLSQNAQLKVRQWLRDGISPTRLALTLALGFSIGCLPITGIPTVLCLLLAVYLRLNLPVIQAANLIAWPAQLVVVLPMVKLGVWIEMHALGHEINFAQASGHVWVGIAGKVGGVATQMLLGWIVALGPAILILNYLFRFLIRRVPAATKSLSPLENS